MISKKDTLKVLWQLKEGKKCLAIVVIGIALTFVSAVFHESASKIPFLISIVGMIMCMLGTDQFARIVYMIHAQYDEEPRE